MFHLKRNSNKLLSSFSCCCFSLVVLLWLFILVAFAQSADLESTDPTTLSSISTVTAENEPLSETSTTSLKTTTNSGPFSKLASCDTYKNCTQSQICVNGRCACLPNYAFVNGKCLPRNCYWKRTICQDQDPNRYCETVPVVRYGRCVCQSNFIEDPLTKVCRPKCSMAAVSFIFPRPSVSLVIGQNSTTDSIPSAVPAPSSATICELVDSANSLCNIYRCQCRTNYRRNWITGKCESFRCQTNSQCWSDGDKYRVCNNGTCVCNYDVDPLTERCTIQLSSLFKIRYYYSWHTEKILLCTIIIVPLVFYYCFVQNFRKAKSTLISLKSPELGGNGPVSNGPNQPKFYQNNLVQTKVLKPNYGTDSMKSAAPSSGYKSLPAMNQSVETVVKSDKKQFKYTRFS